MKIFILITLLVLSANAICETPEELHLRGSTHVEVLDENPPPSCDVVKFRLQEYAKRNAETDYLMEWYSPVVQTVEQSEELYRILKRMPDFENDRIRENVKVKYIWGVRKDDFDNLRRFSLWKNTLRTNRINWSDPFNGLFPIGFDFTTYPAPKKMVRLQIVTKMSYEDYCMGNPEVYMTLETPEHLLVMKAENEAYKL